ncbi:MAG: MFS transporter [Friedmanniella sp.]
MSSTAQNLRRYLAAAVLVRVADEGARVALLLLALQRTGSAALGAVLVAALLVPHVAAAPAVGLLTDRTPRPRWVLGAAAVGFAAALAAAAVGLGRLPVSATLAILLVGGCCGPALTGGLTSQLRSLVPERSLPRAFGADSASYSLSGIAGPSVAAVLAGLIGADGATLGLAGSAALGAAVLTVLPLGPRQTRVASASVPGSRLTDGLAAVVHDPVLGTVTAASSLAQLGAGALPVVAAVLSARASRPGAAGLLMTAVAVGGLVGSLLWAWRPAPPERSARTVMVSLLGVGLPLAAAAAVGSLLLVGALFALSGVFLGPLTGALFTVRQRRAPAPLQAQVFTLGAGVKTSCAAGGAALGGLLVGLPSSVQLLLVAGCPILVGSAGLGVLRGVRARATGGGAPSA